MCRISVCPSNGMSTSVWDFQQTMMHAIARRGCITLQETESCTESWLWQSTPWVSIVPSSLAQCFTNWAIHPTPNDTLTWSRSAECHRSLSSLSGSGSPGRWRSRQSDHPMWQGRSPWPAQSGLCPGEGWPSTRMSCSGHGEQLRPHRHFAHAAVRSEPHTNLLSSEPLLFKIKGSGGQDLVLPRTLILPGTLLAS